MKPITEIVRELIEQEKSQCLIDSAQIEWDVESIHEAVQEACIYMGLGTEEFSPSVHFHGWECEILLYA